jgi:hypothetical protein
MNKIGDIFDKDGVYFIITEITNGVMIHSIPLSRYILKNYIGKTEDALKIFQDETFNYEQQKLLNQL